MKNIYLFSFCLFSLFPSLLNAQSDLEVGFVQYSGAPFIKLDIENATNPAHTWWCTYFIKNNGPDPIPPETKIYMSIVMETQATRVVKHWNLYPEPYGEVEGLTPLGLAVGETYTSANMRLDLLASQAFFPLFDPSLSNWEYVVFSVVLWGTEEPTAEQIASLTPTDDGNIANNYSVKVLYDPKETYDELPVRLVSFDVNEAERQHILRWVTSAEENSSYFSIERSSNGKDFKEIGTTSARGDTESVSSYSFTDANLIPGILYYRLKMIDLDGSYEFSPIVSVGGRKISSQQQFSLYPNPTSSSAQIDFTVGNNTAGKIIIINATGKVVSSELRNFSAGDNTLKLETEAFPTGLYYVEVLLNDGTRIAGKILKR